jgi:tRNA(fMet)-specific endonuclease VapC
MEHLVIDTNCIINTIKGNSKGKLISKTIDEDYADFNNVVSVVTVAELNSFGMRLAWGDKKMEAIASYINQISIVDIVANNYALMDAYKLIDSYSRGKAPDANGNYLKSHVKMGKNDLWIAATAYCSKAKLLTCDKDFDHLNKILIDLINF